MISRESQSVEVIMGFNYSNRQEGYVVLVNGERVGSFTCDYDSYRSRPEIGGTLVDFLRDVNGSPEVSVSTIHPPEKLVIDGHSYKGSLKLSHILGVQNWMTREIRNRKSGGVTK